MVEVLAQIVGVALALDLGLDPGRQLLRVDRTRQDVVDADLQRLDQARTLVGIDHGQDRQVTGAFVRTQAGGEAQAVEALGRGVDNDQVDGAAGADLGLHGIGFDHRAMLDRQLGGHALGLALVVVDHQHPAAQAVQSRGGAGDHADAAARGLALAQFVQDQLEARQAAHAGEQHDVVDRLGQEVRSARLQALDAVGAAIQRRDQHHGDVAGDGVFLEFLADGEAVHAGHHHVQQDHVGQFVGRDGQGRGAVIGHRDLVILSRQLGLEQADIGLDIVDDQDARAHDLPLQQPANGVQEVRHRDGLGDIGLAPALADALLVALHGECRNRDHGDM
jgi:hypothetical protein